MKTIPNRNAVARLLVAGAALLLSGCVTISEPMEEPSAIPPSPTAALGLSLAAAVEQAPIALADVADAASPTPRPTNQASPTPTLTPTVTPTPITYVVAAGDTLGSIAKRFGIPLEALLAANGIGDADRLSIDQVLVIPTVGQGGAAEVTVAGTAVVAPPTTEEGHLIHFVQVGETLSAIAALYGVPRDDVLLANGLRPDAQLTAGDMVIVPQGPYTPIPTATALAATPVPTLIIALEPSATPIPASPTPAPTATPATHIVQPGEIAGVIARDNGISVEALAAANPGANMDNLTIGQTLTIPRPASTTSATPTAVTLEPTATPTSVPPVMATHVAREGETWATIAGLYGLDAPTIQGYNPTLTETLTAAVVVQIPLGTPTPTPSPTVPPTLTPTPAPAYVAPVLLLPANGSTWLHWEGKQPLQLLWTSSGILDDDEFYVVRLRALDKAGDVLWTQTHWTQSSNWRLPEDLLSSVREPVTLRWDVLVMRRTSAPGVAPQTGEALSNKSDTFEIFFSYSGS